jgi:bifunctional non-homologous end joining protein LigD
MAVKTKGTLQVEGQEVTITNPDKLIWPEPKITKMLYLEKLVRLSPYLLTYCRDRYLTTIRFPDGIEHKSFYQKNCPEPAPGFVKTAAQGDIHYVNADSLPTLLWLGNLACLEFHPSFEYIGSTMPAEWVIDIDPSLEEEPRIFEAAYIVGELLRSLQIESIAKTSGATGIQIFVPIERKYTFDQLRHIGKFIGTYLVEKFPKLFTIERMKKDRGNLIYIDYLQHWAGKTLSAPYTPRARFGAPVSTPLEWDEVKSNQLHPADFNLLNIEQRLQEKGDLISQVPLQSLDHILQSI